MLTRALQSVLNLGPMHATRTKVHAYTYRSDLTASAIIASATTSAIAEPIFCTVKKIMRGNLDDLSEAFRPKIIHGTRENTVEIIR